MKKIILSALLSILSLGGIMAQEQLKLLNVQETTVGIGVYPCGDRHEAMVQFVTNEPFALSFESTHDNELDIQIDSVAGKKTYSIVFITQAPGQNYGARRLIIRAPGFQDYRLPLPLQDKQKFEYTISDPYSKLRSPFFLYFEKAQQAFNEGVYQTAKDNYELCRYCPEYAKDSVRIIEHIGICDSMLLWHEQALQAEHFHEYAKAAGYYNQMLRFNKSEELRNSLYKMQQDFNGDCEALMRMAQLYFNQGELEKSQEKLENIIDNGCTLIGKDAAEMLNDVRDALVRRNEHARSFMFAWAPNMMGFTRGNFYESRNHSWYATFMMNRDIFDLVTMKAAPEGEVEGIIETANKVYDLSKIEDKNFKYTDMKTDASNFGNVYPSDNKLDYEVMFSIGCDWNLYKPLFIHFGLGYHGGGFSTFSAENFRAARSKTKYKSIDLGNQDTWTREFRYESSKINWFNGAAPEIGLALKYWRLIVKGTYQYTYWINNNDYEDLLKKNTHGFHLGVGFCW